MLMSAGGCCEALGNTPVLILSSYPVGGARTQRKEIFGGLDEGTGKEEPGFFGKLAAAVAYGKLKSLSNLILCIFILDLLKKIKRWGLCLPDGSAVARSWLSTALTSQAQVILPSQPPREPGLQECAPTPS
ncbi:uncharacterized protein LOC116470453 isoform X2 [Hylobates moloch]|uniref:uncharacterized protein LOC116470453 isoform X2 n=1 Tax=Hylobates moloch TaxID=81572 RepID=UPI0026753D94|nr:uncharacterized protein LOC116470453 isoform X2 [Hylobates moloch]